MEHTKEPWIEAGPSYGEKSPVHITSIVPVECDEYEMQVDICCFDPMADKETNAANARRIVACVNACAGIETDGENSLQWLIDHDQIGKPMHTLLLKALDWDKVAKERTDAILQRDELLAALAEIALKILSVTENDDVMPFPSAIESGAPSTPDLAKWFNELRQLAYKAEAHHA